MKRVTVYSKNRVFNGFFKIDEVEVSFERFDGQMSRRLTRLCFERGDSVAAVIYNRDSQRAIFVNQFKYPTYEKGPGWIMETLAGIIEPGETPESAVRREVLEEAGYQVDHLEPIATFYVSPGGSSERIVLYYVEVSSNGKRGEGGGVPSEGEDIETVEFSIEELAGLLTSGGVQDAKTIVGIQWLLRKLDPGTRR
jgi:ADP-ribose pyrophosphatase